MSLGRLFGFLRREPSTPTDWTGPPDDTPIHRWLDARGVPWRATRADLAQRYGVRTDPAYDWPIIPIETPQPVVAGLIQPLHAQAFEVLSPRAPAGEFFATVWVEDDARRNIRAAAAELEPHLGPVRVARQHNTEHAEWRFGRASVELTVWPRDLQANLSLEIPAHERDPRLATACHVQVRTGLRLPPSDAERAWLDSFEEIERIAPEAMFTPQMLRINYAAPTELEFIRELPDGYGHLCGLLGRSRNGEAIVLCRSQLYVILGADVTGVRVDGLLPGRGPGGAWLYLDVATQEPDCPQKQILICEGAAAGDLDETGRRLARALGVPLTIQDPSYDV